MDKEARRGWSTRRKVTALAGAAVAVCVGVVAAFAFAGDESVVGVKSTTTPEGTRVPISRSIDASTLVYKGKLGSATVYLADGAGPTAGMKCVVLAREDLTRTACDTPAVVARSGLVLSEDAGPAQLRVSGYLPGGVEAGANGPLSAQGEFFEGVVPKSQGTVALTRGGAPVELVVPGSR